MVDVGPDAFLRFHIYLMEYKTLLLARLTEENGEIARLITVFDLDGFTASHMNKSGKRVCSSLRCVVL